ncbi:hypothetical protein [Thiobacillus sp.]|uniref:hypothetical protein n=1 Tax=Thiobacillus sp. TaxID=924 RepID=UPI00286DBCDB|nr:hypothetical protein [Thiobacillus sp.]
MTPDEKQEFADQFVALYLSMGLGSLPKREIDLFVFHFLTKSSGYRGKSNYELANAFGVPESKIKALRLHSALRHEDINPHAVLSRIVNRLIHSEQYAALSEGKIEISLEDPVEKRELENFLKARGHHAEYSLNSEVLKISAGRLLELIMEHANRANDEFAAIIRAHISDSAISDRILTDAPTLKQKLDKLRAENLNMETLKSLIGAGFTLLTGA